MLRNVPGSKASKFKALPGRRHRARYAWRRQKTLLFGGDTLRVSHCGCYNLLMRMQGQRDRGIAGIFAARRHGVQRVSILLALALTPALAGCSSFSSPSPAAANSSPAAYQPASAQATPASDPALSYSPYPSKSLVEVLTEGSNPPSTGSTALAPGAPHPPGTYTPSSPPYQATPPAHDASANSSAAAAPPDSSDLPAASPYPKQSLVDIFSR